MIEPLNHIIITQTMDHTHSKENRPAPQSAPQSNNTFIHNLLFPKKSWSEDEDRLLIAVVNRFGANKWSHIAKYIPNRLGKQCRERWYNHLSPNINRAEWTQEEEWTLFLAHTVFGGKWAKLTKLLPGRTDNGIKNHWNSIMRKRKNQMQEKLNQLLLQDVMNPTPMSKAMQLLKDKNPEAIGLQAQIQSDLSKSLEEPLQSALVKSDSSDSVSFNNLLRKIDEKDTLNLQRKQSYKYCGWRNLSSEKKRLSHCVSDDHEPKIVTSKTIADKENRLCQIDDLLQEQELPLPLPIKRLSSVDYSSPLHQKNDYQLIL